jgi:hypothetical protein
MFIIGYLDRISDNRLRIPDYHTGHLGFVPGTTVLSVGPARDRLPGDDRPNSETSAELVITPFNLQNSIYRVTCRFIEGQGIVNRFVALLAQLRISILSLETASVSLSRFHVISATIDISPNEVFAYLNREVPEDKLIQFRHLLWSLHADDYIAFNLALHIVQSCHDVLSWSNKREHLAVPDISISPLTGGLGRTEIYNMGSRLTIERGLFAKDSKRPSTFVTLPSDTLGLIRYEIGEQVHRSIHFIMVSETYSRSLRIKFINSDRVANLMQVGFRTTDEAGALNAITEALRQANFNIIVSLTRKLNQLFSVWEAVLEYEGQGNDHHNQDRSRFASLEFQREFVKGRLEDPSIRWPSRARRFQISVFTPSHIPDMWLDKRRQTASGLGAENAQPLAIREATERDATSHRVIEGTRKPSSFPGTGGRRWIVDYTANFPKRNRVFISYPTAAKDLMELLHERLERPRSPEEVPEWAVEKYDGNAGLPEEVDRIVRHKILISDFFVGIWRSEPDSDSEISPWLPYELGVAKAYQKHCCLIVSRRLPERVFRVEPAIERISFTDMGDFQKRVDETLLPRLRRIQGTD